MMDPQNIDEVLERLEEIEALPAGEQAAQAVELASEQLAMGELILETWNIAHDQLPTDRQKEGFRILALHSQGSKGIPSFNACRETTREIVFHYNVILQAGDDETRLGAMKLMVMVVRHLALFVSGKLQVAGLGDFCCASKPLRLAEAQLESGL